MSRARDNAAPAGRDPWGARARYLMPAFRRARIGGYRDDIVALTARMLDGWRIGEQRDIWRDMRGLTRRLVGAILVGLEPDEAAHLGALMARWLELHGLNRFLLWSIDRPGTPYHTLLRLSECLERRLLAVAERRRQAPGPDDALSLLVQQDGGLDRGRLVGQYTGSIVTWMLYSRSGVASQVREARLGPIRFS